MFIMSVTNLMYYVFKLLKSFDIVSVINVLTSRAKPKKQIMSSDKVWSYWTYILCLKDCIFSSQIMIYIGLHYLLFWGLIMCARYSILL